MMASMEEDVASEFEEVELGSEELGIDSDSIGSEELGTDGDSNSPGGQGCSGKGFGNTLIDTKLRTMGFFPSLS